MVHSDQFNPAYGGNSGKRYFNNRFCRFHQPACYHKGAFDNPGLYGHEKGTPDTLLVPGSLHDSVFLRHAGDFSNCVNKSHGYQISSMEQNTVHSSIQVNRLQFNKSNPKSHKRNTSQLSNSELLFYREDQEYLSINIFIDFLKRSMATARSLVSSFEFTSILLLRLPLLIL